MHQHEMGERDIQVFRGEIQNCQLYLNHVILKVEEVVVTNILVMVGQMASPVSLARDNLAATTAMLALVVDLMSQPFPWNISL